MSLDLPVVETEEKSYDKLTEKVLDQVKAEYAKRIGEKGVRGETMFLMGGGRSFDQVIFCIKNKARLKKVMLARGDAVRDVKEIKIKKNEDEKGQTLYCCLADVD